MSNLKRTLALITTNYRFGRNEENTRGIFVLILNNLNKIISRFVIRLVWMFDYF